MSRSTPCSTEGSLALKSLPSTRPRFTLIEGSLDAVVLGDAPKGVPRTDRDRLGPDAIEGLGKPGFRRIGRDDGDDDARDEDERGAQGEE